MKKQHVHTQELQPLTFSVIMPCYNSAVYVRNAVNSIVKQTYPHWELVAINDGSTDDTLAILEEFALKDARIKIHSQKNGGYVSAVNAGLERITGDYFLLMGSDDTLGATLFQELSGYSHIDCIAFRTILVENGRASCTESITNFTGDVQQCNTTLAEFTQAYPTHAAIFATRDTSKCFRRTLLSDLRYWGQYGFDADGIFSLLLCHRAESFAAIATDGYYWTLRPDSLSARKSSFAQDLDRVEIWCKFYSQLDRLSPSEIIKTEREYLYYFLNITENTWRACQGLENLATIQQAAELICRIAEKTCFRLSLSAQSRLLLRSPLAWKLSAPFWKLIYQLKQKKIFTKIRNDLDE